MSSVAILIPSFNGASTISCTLNSIQSQASLSKVSRVLLADDCSQDETIELAEVAWRAPIPFLVSRNGQNAGECENVSRAILHLGESFDWVLILHQDDLAKPNWLQMMLDRIEGCQERVGSICSSWDEFSTDGKLVRGEDDCGRDIEIIEGNAESIRGTLLRGTWWHMSGCAIRTITFKETGGLDSQLPYGGDQEWLLRCLGNGWAVEYIPRTLISYRQHNLSVSSTFTRSGKDIESTLQIIRRYSKFLTKNDLLALHMKLIKYCGRRFLKAAIFFNFEKVNQTAKSAWSIVHNWAKC